MKRIIQIVLLFVLIIIIFIFYNMYFKGEDKAQIKETISTDKVVNQSENNLIKNLKYEISIEENNDYRISSELSEITYKDGSELVLMKKVTAILTDKNNVSLFVTSDNASYNNTNYNTIFENNVKITYLDSMILSEKMTLDFDKNYISVNDNVRYNGPLGNLDADNIKINLISKKINIFMNNANENIVITSSK
jgi:LPS export ABC transporter protein LptC